MNNFYSKEYILRFILSFSGAMLILNFDDKIIEIVGLIFILFTNIITVSICFKK